MAKRKADDGPDIQRNLVEIIPLGAGQEVGRSCIILKYMGKTVMLDCGIHPGFSGMNSLPFFDEIDLDTVDAMLVTHFHLDHCAAVPYVVGKTNFKGRILMTHPTKAIYGTLLRDFVKVSRGSSDEALYSDKDLERALERSEVLDFHQTIDLDGIKVTAWRAGHVLGAAMFMVEIAGLRVLYTGDYSRLADRHMSAADLPDQQPHIVIVEATYGVSQHEPRQEREQRFVDRLRQVVGRGGRVLLPVVALGRAQELLLILEEHWERNPALRSVPIYQASGLAQKALTVYQTYIEMMNDAIKAAFQAANPFVFKHVQHVASARALEGVGACVVMATPSMLQSGLSRELFEAWCEDPRNGVIIADFAVQGTLARQLLDSPSHVITRAGAKVPLRMSVDAISFSAHADYTQTSQFIAALAPPHVVLVHGEATEMGRLRKALEQQAGALGQPRQLYMPRVAQPVHITHQAQHLAKVVGRLADRAAGEGAGVAGLLVRQPGGGDLLLAPDDLPAFTRLRPGRVLQRQALALRQPFAQVRLALEGFEGGGGPNGGAHGAAVLEWEGGAPGDTVADAVVAVILQAGGEPAGMPGAEAARRAALAAGDAAGAAAAEAALLAALLSAQFGAARVDSELGFVLVDADGRVAAVDPRSGRVDCGDDALRSRIEAAVGRLAAALAPAALDAFEGAFGQQQTCKVGASAGVSATMPIENGRLCRQQLVPLAKILGMKGFNAFGSSFQFGEADGPDGLGVEGPWVAPIFTTGILLIIAYLTYYAKIGNNTPPTLLRKIIALYAFNTAIVEVCRVVFDVNRFALVWAALHNLAEWGIIGHLVVNSDLVGTFFERSLLWIWLISQVVLFAPFTAGALTEQATGIWCDWLLITLMTYHLVIRKDKTDRKVLAVYKWGFLGAITHMAEILPLVSLLVGLITLPSILGSILIAVSEPLTFYFYYNFALEWDKSLLQPEAPAQADAGGAATAPNGTPAHTPSTSYEQGFQSSVNLTASKPGGPAGTELPRRIKVAIGVGTFILGLMTVVAPVLIIPGCKSTPVPPNFVPFQPLIKKLGTGKTPAALPDGAGPLCRAPQTVEGTTFIYARPGRGRELATLLESHPMSARRDEGNLKFEVSETEDHVFRIDERWTSKRTMFNRFTKPDSRAYLTPAFADLVRKVDVNGPFNPYIPCVTAALQPREYFIREPIVVDAPLTCVWAQLDNFADGSTSVGAVAWVGNLDGNPQLREVTEPFFKPSANCTMRQFRQLIPTVPQPADGHRLVFHSLSGCWVDPAEPTALVETQITEMVVTPHAGTSLTAGKTDLVYTLRLSPKTIADTEGMLARFRAGNVSHMPKLKALLERRCAGARIKALSQELEAATMQAFA
ncbi:hypothetical protein WJX81_008406 [Elliptochloris bilobata]|uniref:Cleavage and polyadenylation specificity factor subunit 3 n=1 Tax=Elliptochloris bilobata TaxID=381761 RepID=A0AAW1QLA8_9CHLO